MEEQDIDRRPNDWLKSSTPLDSIEGMDCRFLQISIREEGPVVPVLPAQVEMTPAQSVEEQAIDIHPEDPPQMFIRRLPLELVEERYFFFAFLPGHT